ncbi:Stk1 family PASTA domain-containing Ser/Thr kinase [Actinomyces vulturis]|uniref:Stk1 family PASTA domain-containing Ser/Thr kinase n=1 Tax=Actinomyces vulturis TaxID=1857645 RepID=UPI0008339557|nr:Stk1 family PASTA domain-containing Ser/Thr kinase [Actinomyces vulturis]
MTDTVPQVLAGRYEIRDLIGRGGMAEVHLGYDKRLSRTVAIKVLRSDIADDATFQARFRREAQSAAALNHPAIVAVYDSGEESITHADGSVAKVPYIVMEYVEGHTVRELIAEGEAVPIDEAVEIVVGVLDALEYSHRIGIVHRDIKPGNIMLTATGAVKVMDFGIARAIEDSAVSVTQTHAVVGTAQYLSPEQARGENVDARSDLYSTGCLLYELLTGRPPFKGDSAVSIAYQHVREIPRKPSSIAPDISDAIDRVVLQSLAKKREDRYQDAAHMRADLLRAARGSGAVAAPSVDSWTQATSVMTPTPDSVNQAMNTASGNFYAEASSLDSLNSTRSDIPPVPKADPHSKGKPAWVWIFIVALLALIAGAIAYTVSGGFDKTPAPEPTASPTVDVLKIPDVTNMDEAAARNALETLGLVFSKGSDVASDTVPEGKAVSMDPKAGTKVAPGVTVTVHFSSGSAMVPVPDVAKKTQAEAREIISKAGLVVGDVTTVDAPDIKAGQVVRTDPVAGTSVKRGSTVKLELSSGKITVPNGVVGTERQQAEQTLSEAGFTRITIVIATTHDETMNNVVESCSLEPGTVVDAGTEIKLTVGQYEPEPTEPPQPVEPTKAPDNGANPTKAPTNG